MCVCVAVKEEEKYYSKIPILLIMIWFFKQTSILLLLFNFFHLFFIFFFLQFKISVLLLFPFQQLLLIFPTIIFLLAITLFLCCSQQCQTPTVRTADSLFLTISKTSYSGTCLLYILPNYFFFTFHLVFSSFFFLRIKASVNQIIIKG